MPAEDNIARIVYEEFFEEAKTGTIVEVGAAHPSYLSNSSLFRRLGWRVIAVEPNPVFCDMHRALGYPVLQFACGKNDVDDVDFQIVDSHGKPYKGGNVTFESFSALRVKDDYVKRLAAGALDVHTVRVSVRRLDTLLADAGVEEVDLLFVDVEGWELDVLQGLDFERYHPRVVVVENLLDSPEYPKLFERLGYRTWRHSWPNEVYCRG